MSSSDLVRWGGIAAMAGGALWAVTPLREPVLGGGGLPGDPIFRPYNFVLLIIAALLTLGLLALRAQYKGDTGAWGTVGVAVIFAGYALLFVGSIPAVLLSPGTLRSLIQAGQDLGFLGALIAGVGAVPLGIVLWRARAASRLGALLLIIALPVGFIGVILVAAVGFEDIAGLPLTVVYGGAWVILGYQLWSGASTQDQQPSRVR